MIRPRLIESITVNMANGTNPSVATLQRLMKRDAALTERASCYLGMLALESRDFAAAEKIFKKVTGNVKVSAAEQASGACEGHRLQ